MSDLVTLDNVKDWLGIKEENKDDDNSIQFVISSFSEWVLNRTGIDSFTEVATYNECYDGNGQTRMFLRNSPIRSIISIQMGPYSPPMSSGPMAAGIYIEQSQKSIAFRSSMGQMMVPLGIYPYFFTPGQGNIQVNYTAGYTKVPEDLAEATRKAVALYYRRKDWIDLASKSLSVSGGTGTTTYRNWALPTEIERILEFYSRYARP